MEPTFRCGTRKAIDELAEELNEVERKANARFHIYEEEE